MLSKPGRLNHSMPLIPIILVTAIYFCLFPFTYFRHDDWIHLGNSVVFLPDDWSLLWRVTQYYTPTHESTWFFRPFVKGLVYLNYQAFGYRHTLWLVSQWAWTLGAVFFGYRSLQLLEKGKGAILFLFLFPLSIQLHLGSVLWVGEGVMNCPQLFFLSLSIFSFLKDLKKKSAPSYWLIVSTLSLAMALGFKESSASLVFFLATLIFCKKEFHRYWKRLIPLTALTVAYVYYRLFVLPLNGYYHPVTRFLEWRNSIGFFVVFIGMSFAVFYTCNLIWKMGVRFQWKKMLWFTPFLTLTILPHLGHDFLSPGWLILPGFYFLWVIALYSEPNWVRFQKHQYAFGAVLLFISALPVGYRFYQLEWWKWHESQVAVHEFFQSLPESTKKIRLSNCEQNATPDVGMERVIGPDDSLKHLWRLNHNKPIRIVMSRCDEHKLYEEPIEPNTVSAYWVFPKFQVVHGPP